jgi:hypothetical protein
MNDTATFLRLFTSLAIIIAAIGIAMAWHSTPAVP